MTDKKCTVHGIDREVDRIVDGAGRIIRESVSWVVRWTTHESGFVDQDKGAMFADVEKAARFAAELESHGDR